MAEAASAGQDADRRAVLIYNAACGPCRRLSVLAVILALGQARRCEVDSREAADLLAQRPELRGKLVLLHGGGGPLRMREAAMGWGVFPALPRAVFRGLRGALAASAKEGC